MRMEVFLGIMLPFAGTALGSGCVFFMKKDSGGMVQRTLTGFAGGVMVAASIWSLILPAIEQSRTLGKLSFLPACVGFWIGIFFLLFLDSVIQKLHRDAWKARGTGADLKKMTMMVLAVTLHNIPEGMAVGVVYAGLLVGSASVTAGSALTLAIGIAIQNFPEGAIISLPLCANGKSRGKAFFDGVLSGIVEPCGAFLTVLATGSVIFVMPYLLGFAAGAMMYVVVGELIPEIASGRRSNIGVVMFAAGFTLMMALDAALG